MNKLLSSILASTMLLSTLGTSFAQETTQTPEQVQEIQQETLSTVNNTTMYALYARYLDTVEKDPDIEIVHNINYIAAALMDMTGNGVDEMVLVYYSKTESTTCEIWSFSGYDIQLLKKMNFNGSSGERLSNFYIIEETPAVLMRQGGYLIEESGTDKLDQEYFAIYNKYYFNDQGIFTEDTYTDNGWTNVYTLNGKTITQAQYESEAGYDALRAKYKDFWWESYADSGAYGSSARDFLKGYLNVQIPTYPDWASSFIDYVYPSIMPDLTATNYDDGTTRGTIAQSLYNLAGNGVVVSATKDFNDLGNYATAISWCDASGIMNGKSDVYFATNETVTREQLCLILRQLATYQGKNTLSANISSLSKFSDAKSISSWAQEAVAWAVANNLMQGNENALNPHGDVTRLEVAVMLKAFSQL